MLNRDEILKIAAAAGRAPSGDNVQPWRFVSRKGGSVFDIQVDRSRDQSSLNVHLIPSLISAGAAMENARIAVRSWFGKDFEIKPASILAGDDPFPLAVRMEIIPMKCERPPPRLIETVFERNVHRGLFQGGELSDVDSRFWKLAASSASDNYPQTKIILIREAHLLNEIAGLISESSRLLFEVDAFRKHIFGNVRFPGKDHPLPSDGMPVATLGVHGLKRFLVKCLQSETFSRLSARLGSGKQMGQNDKNLAASASAFALVLAPSDSPRDVVLTGASMQHLWLNLAASRLAVQPMTSPMLHAWMILLKACDAYRPRQRRKAEEITHRFESLRGSEKGFPIMFLRLGRAAPFSPRSGRRPVQETLLFED